MRRLSTIILAAALMAGFSLTATVPAYAGAAAQSATTLIASSADSPNARGPDRTWGDLPDTLMDEYAVTPGQVAAISEGYPDGLWKPYQNVTRAQFVKMTVTAFGVEMADPLSGSFFDVSPSHVYYRYIEGAKAAGLIAGVTPGQFSPDTAITRQQAIAIVGRYVAKLSGESLKDKYPQAQRDSLLAPFKDGTHVSEELQDEVAFALECGLATGDDQGNLAPLAEMTRIQGAAFAIRAQATIEATEYSGAEMVTAAVGGTTRYEQTNENISYTGYWRTTSAASYSAGNEKRASTSGASLTATFTGTSLTWIASTGPFNGMARVTLDGRTPVLLDLFSASTLYRRAVYSTGFLARGSHTVKIEWTGRRNPMSMSTRVSVDALDVMGSLVPGLPATATTPQAPSTTTTRPTPTTTTPGPPATAPPTTATAVRGVISVRDYGAKGDGSSNDTSAIQACLNAAASQGKTCYLPAGTYRTYTLNPPNGVTMQGAGAGQTTIRTLAAKGAAIDSFDLVNKSYVTIQDLSLIGASTDGHMYGNDQGIYMANSHNITIKNVQFNYWTFAMRTGSDGAVRGSSNISVIGCRTLGGSLTGFLGAYTNGLTISGCDFDSATVNTRNDPGGPSHHLYFLVSVSNVDIQGTTFRNGDSWSVQIYPDGGLKDMTFSNVTWSNVYAGIYVGPGSYLTFDGVTASSNRYVGDGVPWFSLSGSDITVQNFNVSGASKLVSASGSNIVFRNGTYAGTNLGSGATFQDVD